MSLRELYEKTRGAISEASMAFWIEFIGGDGAYERFCKSRSDRGPQDASEIRISYFPKDLLTNPHTASRQGS